MVRGTRVIQMMDRPNLSDLPIIQSARRKELDGTHGHYADTISSTVAASLSRAGA